jgi:hypothetical protein
LPENKPISTAAFDAALDKMQRQWIVKQALPGRSDGRSAAEVVDAELPVDETVSCPDRSAQKFIVLPIPNEGVEQMRLPGRDNSSFNADQNLQVLLPSQHFSVRSAILDSLE